MKKQNLSIKTILCDDIRQELGNKISIIGIYSKDLIVEKTPSILPKLCIAFFLENADPIPENLIFWIKTGEDEPKKLGLITLQDKPLKEKPGSIFGGLQMAPFKIDKAGSVEIQIFFGKDKNPSAIHRFNIKTSTLSKKNS